MYRYSIAQHLTIFMVLWLQNFLINLYKSGKSNLMRLQFGNQLLVNFYQNLLGFGVKIQNELIAYGVLALWDAEHFVVGGLPLLDTLPSVPLLCGRPLGLVGEVLVLDDLPDLVPPLGLTVLVIF